MVTNGAKTDPWGIPMRWRQTVELSIKISQNLSMKSWWSYSNWKLKWYNIEQTPAISTDWKSRQGNLIGKIYGQSNNGWKQIRFMQFLMEWQNKDN